MTREELLNNGFKTRVAGEIATDEFHIITLDLASLDDDGWQVREGYVSKAGQDDFIQATHADGHNGWSIATQCGFHSAKRVAEVAGHLGISSQELTALMEWVSDEIQLYSTDFSMLEELQSEAAEREERAAKGGAL